MSKTVGSSGIFFKVMDLANLAIESAQASRLVFVDYAQESKGASSPALWTVEIKSHMLYVTCDWVFVSMFYFQGKPRHE